MNKLALDLDTIVVQSFFTKRRATPVPGTVRGHQDAEVLTPSYLAPSQCYTSCTREARG